MDTASFKAMVKLTPTRFKEENCALYIGKIAPSVWQVCVETDGTMAQTGAQSKTKMEAFSVLPEVARQWGFEV